MVLIYSVENRDKPIRISKNLSVALLVCVAVCANTWAFHRIGEIKRDIVFREQLGKNLDALMIATDAIASKRGVH